MAGIVEYWNGIPVSRAQPVLSDLQRWQARQPVAARPAPVLQSAGRPSAMPQGAADPAAGRPSR